MSQRWPALEVDYVGDAAAGFMLAEKVRMNRRIFDSEPTSVVTRKEQYRVD